MADETAAPARRTWRPDLTPEEFTKLEQLLADTKLTHEQLVTLLVRGVLEAKIGVKRETRHVLSTPNGG